MLNVICFLWGNWPAKEWGPKYVRRLRNGVARHLPRAHRFTAFCDARNLAPVLDQGVNARLLNAPSWKGCLPKLYAYCPENGLIGRTLIFDLDSIITGDLSRMAAWHGDLAVRAWFGGWPEQRVADGDMISFVAGSDMACRLWADAQDPAIEADTGGRERFFLRRYDPALWQDILGPRAVLSYKRHLAGGRPLPEECVVVSCHDGGGPGGTVRPHQLSEAWVGEHWR